MEIEKKIELNKMIRSYNGYNTFIISLQTQLKTNKNLKKESLNNKEYKVLSDKQYSIAENLLND